MCYFILREMQTTRSMTHKLITQSFPIYLFHEKRACLNYSGSFRSYQSRLLHIHPQPQTQIQTSTEKQPIASFESIINDSAKHDSISIISSTPKVKELEKLSFATQWNHEIIGLLNQRKDDEVWLLLISMKSSNLLSTLSPIHLASLTDLAIKK